MIRSTTTVPIVALLALTLGCAKPPLEIEQASNAYQAALEDPALASNASVELYEAGKAVDSAQSAWTLRRDEEDARTHAYLAQRRIEIARAAARRKIAEAEVSQLGQERQEVLLSARTEEAETRARQAMAAQEEAERARRDAEARAAEAQAARREADEAAARVASLQKEIEALGAKQTDRGLVLTLGDVLFDTDRAELKPGALRNLDRLVSFLREHSDRAVLIEGHTDSTGQARYNLDLAQRRARSVRSFLLENDISASRVIAEGYGESYPVASNASGGGRQQNRRVEVVILEPGQDAASAGRPPVSAAPPVITHKPGGARLPPALPPPPPATARAARRPPGHRRAECP